MDWIDRYQLYLFDFDGLLVNSEYLHYQAFMSWLESYGYKVDWSFLKYCSVAHETASSLRETVCAEFSDLRDDWDAQYKKKKEIYFNLLPSHNIDLMPGVSFLLTALEEAKIRRCVVTNSPHEQIALIRCQHPVLETIPHWITREDYEKPKPDPESYLRAIELYGKKGDRIIGFEDSIRGIEALKKTSAHPVLVCSSKHPQLEMVMSPEISHFESFEKIPNDWMGG